MHRIYACQILGGFLLCTGKQLSLNPEPFIDGLHILDLPNMLPYSFYDRKLCLGFLIFTGLNFRDFCDCGKIANFVFRQNIRDQNLVETWLRLLIYRL